MKNLEIIDKLTEFAVEACLSEVSCFPSPGLVSPVSKGAHKDMNYFTFIGSTTALIKTFYKCSSLGCEAKDEKELFKGLIEAGKIGEAEMLKKTSGVNTQKGLLFILGISLAASSRAYILGLKFEDIREIIKKITAGIVSRDLDNIDINKPMSHGEKIYLKYKIDGIRGQIEKGLPLIFDYSLKIFEDNNDLDLNHRLVHTLLYIIKELDDTNILYRHSLDTLSYVKKRAEKILTKGGMKTIEGREQTDEFDRELSIKNISPGGSADILAATYYFYLLKKYWRESGHDI